MASALGPCTRCGEVKPGEAPVVTAGAIPQAGFLCYDCKRELAASADDEIRAELVGAPRELARLQDKAQRAHGVVLADEDEIICGEAGVVAIWRRGGLIEGTGPMPTYYYNFAGSAVVQFTGRA